MSGSGAAFELSDESGQAIAEFVLVLFTLILVLFAILELGLLLNAKLALASAAREIARVCAVEGGYVAKAMERVDSVIKSTIAGNRITLRARAVTRSEFVPRE